MPSPPPSRPAAAAGPPPAPERRAPEPLGLRRSLGFGDRLGLATPGHIAAVRRFSIAPVFAQLSPRDLARAGTHPAHWIARIARHVAEAHLPRAWGADAHGTKTEADIAAMAAADVSWFTLDPSAFVENRADTLAPAALAEDLAALGKEGVLPADWIATHAAVPVELDGASTLAPQPEALARAAVKFARALQHAQRLNRHVASHTRHPAPDLELALVECAAPATAAEHLFIAIEARRRGLPLTALALRWHVGIEPGAEFLGDPSAFERDLRVHAAIARRFGPYKLSFHHGGDTLAILPVMARVCGEHLHVKTAAATFLTAMRVVCRAAPDLFREIALFARHRFANERVPHLVSTTTGDVDRLFQAPAMGELESNFLDTPAGRQLLDTASASILQAGLTSRGRPFRDAVAEVLHTYRDEHHALLDATFTRHLELLNQG